MQNMHLLDIESQNIADIHSIFEIAENISSMNKILLDKSVLSLFFEHSTRTSISFQIAAQMLGANVIDVNHHLSSLNKGEDIFDMFLYLDCYSPEFMVIRHPENNFPHKIASNVKCSIINAGDGINEHPSQSIIDLYTIKSAKGDVKNLNVSIIGDILHSRVAHSSIKLLDMMGAKINIIAPPTLIPTTCPLNIFHCVEDGIQNADVIIVLRLQREKAQKSALMPSDAEYANRYCLNLNRLSLAKKDVIVLHSGPCIKNIDITDEVLSTSNSMLREQVKNSIKVRQAIFAFLYQNSKMK